jgi:probable rRNA maturation factor
VNVIIEDSQTDLKLQLTHVSAIVEEVLKNEGVKADEVGVHFVPCKILCKLHATYFNDPSPTDCISFPLDLKNQGDHKILGDVFICPATALTFTSANKGCPHMCPWEETLLYLVHGLLHLVGYDDIGEKEPEMRLAEKRHMENLKKLQLGLKKGS